MDWCMLYVRILCTINCHVDVSCHYLILSSSYLHWHQWRWWMNELISLTLMKMVIEEESSSHEIQAMSDKGKGNWEQLQPRLWRHSVIWCVVMAEWCGLWNCAQIYKIMSIINWIYNLQLTERNSLVKHFLSVIWNSKQRISIRSSSYWYLSISHMC